MYICMYICIYYVGGEGGVYTHARAHAHTHTHTSTLQATNKPDSRISQLILFLSPSVL